MMQKNPSHIQKGKKPLYISVYDNLYKLITDGTFSVDSKLPTETELAKELGVSRMTLRQAISLLQDDGLVRSVHGKGNFITRPQRRDHEVGLEKIGNPIYKSHTEEIDDVELDFRLDLESNYTQEVLKRKAAAVVACERWYKSKGKVVAYAFTFMAIETVSEMSIDLQDEKQLLEMLESKVYHLANASTIEIKRSMSVNSSSQKHDIVGGEKCELILESVFINEKYPVVYNKYYIPEEFSQIRINAHK